MPTNCRLCHIEPSIICIIYKYCKYWQAIRTGNPNQTCIQFTVIVVSNTELHVSVLCPLLNVYCSKISFKASNQTCIQFTLYVILLLLEWYRIILWRRSSQRRLGLAVQVWACKFSWKTYYVRVPPTKKKMWLRKCSLKNYDGGNLYGWILFLFSVFIITINNKNEK